MSETSPPALIAIDSSRECSLDGKPEHASARQVRKTLRWLGSAASSASLTTIRTLCGRCALTVSAITVNAALPLASATHEPFRSHCSTRLGGGGGGSSLHCEVFFRA